MDNIDLTEFQDTFKRIGITDDQVNEAVTAYRGLGYDNDGIKNMFEHKVYQLDSEYGMSNVDKMNDTINGVISGIQKGTGVEWASRELIARPVNTFVLPALGKKSYSEEEFQKRTALYKPKTKVGKVSRTIAKYTAGTIGAGKVLGVASKLKYVPAFLGSMFSKPLVTSVVGGATSDLLNWEKGEGRLSDTLKNTPVIGDLTSSLRTTEGESWTTGALKNAAEGGVLGASMEFAIRGVGKAYTSLAQAKNTKQINIANKELHTAMETLKQIEKQEVREEVLKVAGKDTQVAYDIVKQDHTVDDTVEILNPTIERTTEVNNKALNFFRDNPVFKNTQKEIKSSGVVTEAHVKEVLNNSNTIEEAISNTTLYQKLASSSRKAMQIDKRETEELFIENTEKTIDDLFSAAGLDRDSFVIAIDEDVVRMGEDFEHLIAGMRQVKQSISTDITSIYNAIRSSNGDIANELKLKELINQDEKLDRIIRNMSSQAGRTLQSLKRGNNVIGIIKDPYINVLRDPKEAGYFRGLADNLEKELLVDLKQVDFKNIDISEVHLEEVFNNLKKLLSQDMNKLKLDDKFLREASSHLLNKISKASSEEDIKRGVKELSELIVDRKTVLDLARGKELCVDVSAWGKFKRNYWKNQSGFFMHSILSSPMTLKISVGSGLMTGVLHPAAKYIGANLNREKAIAEEAALQFVSMGQSLNEALALGWRSLKTEESLLFGGADIGMKDDISEYLASDLLHRQEAKAWSAESWEANPETTIGKVLDAAGTLIRLGTRGLMASDEAMTQFNYRCIAQARATQEAKAYLSQVKPEFTTTELAAKTEDIFNGYFTKVMHPKSDEILKIANNIPLVHESRSSLFMQPLKSEMNTDTLLTKTASSITSWTQLHPSFKFVIPFIKALTWITEEAADLSPTSFLHNKYRTNKANVLNFNSTMLDKRKWAMSKGKWVLGSAAYMMASLAVSSGMVTGSPPIDNNARKSLKDAGWQEFSLKFIQPDGSTKYVSYAGIEPLATVLGISSDIQEITAHAPESEVQENVFKAVWCLNQNLTNKSFIKSLADQMELLTMTQEQDLNKASRYVQKLLVANTVPNSSFLRWASNDGSMREVRTFIDNYKNVLGMKDQLVERRNVYGEPMTYETDKTSMLSTIASPVRRTTTFNGSEEDRELIRLGSIGYYPPNQTKRLGQLDLLHFSNKYNETAYDEINRLKGVIKIGKLTLRENINQVVNSEYYRRLPDGVGENLSASKTSTLNDIFNTYLTRARNMVIRSNNFVDDDTGASLQESQLILMRERHKKVDTEMVDTANQITDLF